MKYSAFSLWATAVLFIALSIPPFLIDPVLGICSLFGTAIGLELAYREK